MDNSSEGNDKVPEQQSVENIEMPSEPMSETTRVSGFAHGDDMPRKSKRRKLSHKKLLELQKQLETATKEREAKEVLNSKYVTDQSKSVRETNPEPSLRKEIAEKVKEREIEKAIQRARGDSVKDDVGKIRKSIRKEKRKHEKSKEDWAKRVQAVEDEKRLRQERRDKNLKERKEARNQGKKKKVAKRGKKA
eukprot:TRINITY_DN67_c0_g1_i10.p2 TRINITY_DN67_c0_g1~~TRINITY_DN67_c0_g1_i10.p2  ORF type:complete len:192 (-),score=42.10 TRINITY_DN67_c0_g1_i10:1271-1846(-)